MPALRPPIVRTISLLGATVPVSYRADPLDVGRVATATGGVAFASSLSRGDSYRVWSYAPRPSGEQLRRSRANYPADIELGGLAAAATCPVTAPRL